MYKNTQGCFHVLHRFISSVLDLVILFECFGILSASLISICWVFSSKYFGLNAADKRSLLEICIYSISKFPLLYSLGTYYTELLVIIISPNTKCRGYIVFAVFLIIIKSPTTKCRRLIVFASFLIKSPTTKWSGLIIFTPFLIIKVFPKGKTFLLFFRLLLLRSFPFLGKTFLLFFRLLRSFPPQWEDLIVIRFNKSIFFPLAIAKKVLNISLSIFVTCMDIVWNRNL